MRSPGLAAVSPDALRTGLDPDFLGTPVPLPRPGDPAVPVVLLEYVHVSLLLRPGLDLAQTAALDRYGVVATDGAGSVRWTRLLTYDDVVV